jgi:hypothetical protein
MSNTSLGYALEARTVKWLQSIGYRAERVATTAQYGRKDIFGCVDLISVHPSSGVELHQVTVKEGASARRKKIRDAALPWPVRLWLWRKDDRGRWCFTTEEVMPSDAESTPVV